MFANRKDAGEQLGIALQRYRDSKPLVLGIPRGGVETAYYVAKYLKADMSLIVARKLGFPLSPETAFGAIAEDGSIYLSEAAQSLHSTEIQHVIEEQRKEAARRVITLRRGKPLPSLKGRTVILVDDGIATGATLFASIELCKKKQAERVVVAAPVSGSAMERTLRTKVDDVIILEKPADYHAVSQGYRYFDNLTDKEVLAFIDRWEAERLLIAPFDNSFR